MIASFYRIANVAIGMRGICYAMRDRINYFYLYRIKDIIFFCRQIIVYDHQILLHRIVYCRCLILRLLPISLVQAKKCQPNYYKKILYHTLFF